MKKTIQAVILLLGASIAILVVAAAISILTMSMFGELLGGVVAAFVFIILFSVLLPPVSKNLRMRRRESIQAAGNLLESDPRPPVVYLRAFQEDGTVRPVRLRDAQTPAFPGVILHNYTTFEEELAIQVTKVGPFVALAQPRQLPELGAARLHASDLTWQDTVIALLTRCRLVIFRAGDTENLLWELRKVVELVPPERIIIFLQIGSETDRRVQQVRYDRFRRLAQEVFPKPLPAQRGKTEFLYFTETWEPVLAKTLRKVLKQANL